MTLFENEYIWAVSVTLDDGHRMTVAYFRNQNEADRYARCNTSGGTVYQTTLWHDGTPYTNWYKVTLEPVEVDKEVLKREALKKLTGPEKRALGLE